MFNLFLSPVIRTERGNRYSVAIEQTGFRPVSHSIANGNRIGYEMAIYLDGSPVLFYHCLKTADLSFNPAEPVDKAAHLLLAAVLHPRTAAALRFLLCLLLHFFRRKHPFLIGTHGKSPLSCGIPCWGIQTIYPHEVFVKRKPKEFRRADGESTAIGREREKRKEFLISYNSYVNIGK